MAHQIVQISAEVEEKYTKYYLPSRNPKKVIVVTDHKDSLDSLLIEEVLLSSIKIPYDTWKMTWTKLTLDILSKPRT